MTPGIEIDIYLVMSLDGIVALDENQDISAYSSREDRLFFLDSLKNYDSMLMGKSCYVKDAPPGIRRFILTHNPPKDHHPQDYYLSGHPRDIYKKMSSMGCKKTALIGGPRTCFEFLKEELVDGLYLSVEPVTLGQGLRLFTSQSLLTRWTLKEIKKLNEEGTLVLHYQAVH